MANKQAMVGIRDPLTGRMTHGVWTPGDTLVDPDGNPIGGGGAMTGEWLVPGAADDLTPDETNPAPFRPIFVAWEAMTPYPLGAPPNPVCYERTASGLLLGGDGTVEGFGYTWPPVNNAPSMAIRTPSLFDIAVDIEDYATEYDDGANKVYWPYLSLVFHETTKTNYVWGMHIFATPTTSLTPNVNLVFGYLTIHTDPHYNLGVVDLSSLALPKISLRIRCETLWDNYYKRFSRVWRLGYYNPSSEAWVTLTALIEIPFFVPPTPSSTNVQQRNGEAYEISANLFGDIGQVPLNPQENSHLWTMAQFGVSGFPEVGALNGAAYFKNFRWETSDWDYTIPNPAT